MKNKSTILGAISVIAASILWGLDGVVLTPRLYNLDVVFVVFMLHMIPFVLMNIFLPGEYRTLKKFTVTDLVYFLLVAITGGFLGTYAIVKALFLVNFQQLSVVVLLQKLQPVFAIILASILLKERIRKRFIIWASLAILASYFLVFGAEAPTIDSQINIGLASLYALLAAFSFGSSTVFSKKILTKYSFSTATFYRYGLTAIILFFVVLSTGKLQHGFSDISPTNWLFFFIIGITTGSGAIFLYYFGLVRIRAIVSAICELFFPLSAIFFDYVINHRIISPVQWVAAAIMIFAIFRISHK
ncbi:MAG: DMT family transporter [Bacteroidales bacterium]|nr:DMT family transporter [Bacteroidales bacterium]